jgi:hypothetical protein
VVASKKRGFRPTVMQFDALRPQKYADVYDQRAITD